MECYHRWRFSKVNIWDQRTCFYRYNEIVSSSNWLTNEFFCVRRDYFRSRYFANHQNLRFKPEFYFDKKLSWILLEIREKLITNYGWWQISMSRWIANMFLEGKNKCLFHKKVSKVIFFFKEKIGWQNHLLHSSLVARSYVDQCHF